MARRTLYALGSAVLLAAAVGCTQAGDPLSPTAAGRGSDAAADGSTLKVNAPDLISPKGGVELQTVEPVFVIANPSARFTATPVFDYRYELYTAAGAFVVNSPKVAAGNGQTSWEVPFNLGNDTAYKWRARAELGSNFGPWSGYGEFRTAAYRGIVPRPANGNWPNNGPAVVAYIADSFPTFLRVTSLERRIENMAYLRDRIIEAGICGGLDVAWNLKRGIGPHSIDAIAWRMPNGKIEVIDLASAYDDPAITLRLKWAITDGPQGYDPYIGHPGC